MTDTNSEQKPQKRLVVYLPTRQQPLVFTNKSQILIGRRDEKNNIIPDIDFADYGGFSLGVSRKHAEIRQLDDMYYILDVASSNGTWLNENSLTPFQPKTLQSGDQIRVGQAVLSVRFAEESEFTELDVENKIQNITIRLSANTDYDVFSELGITASRFGKMLADYLQALEDLHELLCELQITEKEEILVQSVRAPIISRSMVIEVTGASTMFTFLRDVLKTNITNDKSVKTRAMTETIDPNSLHEYEFKQTDTIDTIPEPSKVAETLLQKTNLTLDDNERIRFKAQLTRHLTTLFDYLLIPTAIKIGS